MGREGNNEAGRKATRLNHMCVVLDGCLAGETPRIQADTHGESESRLGVIERLWSITAQQQEAATAAVAHSKAVEPHRKAILHPTMGTVHN